MRKYRYISGPLFTKRMDVLSQDLVKSLNPVIECYNKRIALKSGRHLDSATAELPEKIQNDYPSIPISGWSVFIASACQIICPPVWLADCLYVAW